MQFSVACNLKFIYNETLETNMVASNSDADIKEVSFDCPPLGSNLMLTKTGIHFICEGGTVVIYRKCFSTGMCNFKTGEIPTAFNILNRNNLELIGVHGYSSLANLLRRTAENEAFVNHPIAMMLGERNNVEKYIESYNYNYNMVNGSVGNLEESGVSYRLEVTFETKLEPDTDWDTINQNFHVSISDFQELSIDLMLKYGILYPKEVFPGTVKSFCNGFKPALDDIVKKVKDKSYLTIKMKETAVAIENLMIYCINGNEKNLNHSYFTATRIRDSIERLCFPFTKIDINTTSLETALYNDYYCRVKLLQQQMHVDLRNSEVCKLVNIIKYRVENLNDSEYERDTIVNLLSRLFRRDVATVFKKRLLKCDIDSFTKYRLLDLEPENAFFVELEKEVVYNSVKYNSYRHLLFLVK